MTTAASAAEGVTAYAAGRPDLLLSDIGLRDVDGYALLGQIRALEREREWPEVPALALSAYTREGDRKRAAEAGFTDHLGKPVDAHHLVEARRELSSQVR